MGGEFSGNLSVFVGINALIEIKDFPGYERFVELSQTLIKGTKNLRLKLKSHSFTTGPEFLTSSNFECILIIKFSWFRKAYCSD